MLERVLLAAICCLAALAATALAGRAQLPQGEPDHCLICHTTPARLVPAVREARRADSAVSRDMPGASVETEGEG